jgi:hypothetical protein
MYEINENIRPKVELSVFYKQRNEYDADYLEYIKEINDNGTFTYDEIKKTLEKFDEDDPEELDNSEIDCDEDLCYFDDDASIESSMNDENNDIESDLSN